MYFANYVCPFTLIVESPRKLREVVYKTTSYHIKAQLTHRSL